MIQVGHREARGEALCKNPTALDLARCAGLGLAHRSPTSGRPSPVSVEGSTLRAGNTPGTKRGVQCLE